MHRYRKLLQLSITEKILLLQSLFLLGLVTLGLRTTSWLKIQRFLVKWATKRQHKATIEIPSTRCIAWAIRVVSRFIPKATCLPQALVAQHILIRNGYPADFKIGVAKGPNGILDAHAWVTSGNEVVIGGDVNSSRFTPLSSSNVITTEDYGKAL